MRVRTCDAQGMLYFLHIHSFTPTLMNRRLPEFNLNSSLVSLARESQTLRESRFDTKTEQNSYCFPFVELLVNIWKL